MAKITMNEYARRLLLDLGGEGSGNYGHKGRPGQVGGSDDDGVTNKSSSDGASKIYGSALKKRNEKLFNRIVNSHLSIEFVDDVEGSEGKSMGGSYEDGKIKIKKTVSSGKSLADTGPLVMGNQRVVSGGLEQRIGHEVGHHVKDTLMSSSQKREWEQIYSDHKKTAKNAWVKTLSWYAQSSSDEGFAEAFSVYSHSSYNGGLPESVEDFMDNLS